MTNPTLPDHRTTLAPELRALATVGGRRRPVKLVEHPAFRAARARAGLAVPFTVLRIPVVSLNAPVPVAARGCPSLLTAMKAA